MGDRAGAVVPVRLRRRTDRRRTQDHLVVRLAGLVPLPRRDPDLSGTRRYRQSPRARTRHSDGSAGAGLRAHPATRRRSPPTKSPGSPSATWRSSRSPATTAQPYAPAYRPPRRPKGDPRQRSVSRRPTCPKDVNLREHYKAFGELEAVCRTFCDEVNSRTHRVTRRKSPNGSSRNSKGSTRCPDLRSPPPSAPPGG